ncbi:hypothetical protein Btru_038870 [Bulinus truncatus]|nr:hypothetical protein Btru_038870 [Bulinus truncatus]
MDGNNLIDSSGLCVTEFVTSECLPFAQSFNRSDLPNVFQDTTLSSLSVEKPSNLNLVGLVNDFFKSDENILYKVPGLKIEWEAPSSEMSRRNLRGYLFIWQYEGTKSCRLFHFNSSSPFLLKKVSFSYDIQYLVSGGANYTVSVYSIPPPALQLREHDSHSERMMMRSFTMYKNATDPALWSPSVSVKTWANGTVSVKFTLSPPEFRFTQFQVLLVKNSFSPFNLYKQQQYSGNLFSSSEPEGMVQFDNLTTDMYHVIVRVIDPARYVEGQCLCWTFVPNSICPENKCCESSCGSIATQWFLLNVTEMAPQIETTTATKSIFTSSPIFPTLQPMNDGETKEIVVDESCEVAVIACASAVVVLLLIIIVILCLRRNPPHSVIFVKNPPEPLKNGNINRMYVKNYTELLQKEEATLEVSNIFVIYCTNINI